MQVQLGERYTLIEGEYQLIRERFARKRSQLKALGHKFGRVLFYCEKYRVVKDGVTITSHRLSDDGKKIKDMMDIGDIRSARLLTVDTMKKMKVYRHLHVNPKDHVNRSAINKIMINIFTHE